MRPAIRSTFDVVGWLEQYASVAEIELHPDRIMKLLYLSQAVFAAENDAAKLMPATFLATDVGPIEPDLFLSLQYVNVTDKVEPSEAVENVLRSIWDAYGSLGDDDLSLILDSDVAIQAAKKRGRNSEILVPEMAKAYPGGIAALQGDSLVSQFPDGSPYEIGHANLDAAPSATQEIRFTADGRSVTKWIPKKKIRTKDT
jgi:uncharacterized phage-associated protein